MADQAVESIVAAATSLFAGRGADSVSLLEVAKRAKVSAGLIIYHFKSKNNLLFIVSRTILSKIHKASVEAMRSAGTPLQAMHAFIDVFCTFVSMNRDEAFFLAKFDPFLRLDLARFPEAELVVLKDQILGLLAEHLRDGIASKQFNPVPIDAFCLVVWSALLGICHGHNQHVDAFMLMNEIKDMITYRLTCLPGGTCRDVSGQNI